MKIVKAQKKIAHLKGEVSRLKERAKRCVRTQKGNDFTEKFEDLKNIIESKLNELIDLKVKVMRANIESGVFKKVIILGELKSTIELYRALEVESGTYRQEFGAGEVSYVSQMTVKQKNDSIEDLQKKIEKLTEELDDFNAITEI